MKYKVCHITNYAYSQAVPVCHNLVHLAPRELPRQSCEECQVLIHPEPANISHQTDYFGNRVAYFSIEQLHSALTVTATSRVEVVAGLPVEPTATPAWETVVQQLRSDRSDTVLDACEFVSFSPGIQPFDELEEYTRQSFTPGRPILAAVLDLTGRIHRDFQYDPEATTIHTKIAEVFQWRRGLCQDFAHLQIGCLRCLGLAARYVSGYLRTLPPVGQPRLVGADASHAWLSAYCGPAGWVDVDPTNDTLVATDHITVAWGREYSDVCPIQGVIVGGGNPGMSVSVDVAPLEEQLADKS